MSLPVAILAGGLATRLWPVTERIPKCLIDVAGRPFAEHQLDLLRAQGFTDVVFLVGHLGDMVRDALGDGSRLGVHLRYVFDGPRRLGTGGAVREALRVLAGDFFVLYGDSYLDCDYLAVEEAFRSSDKDGLMTVCRNDDLWDRSNVEFHDGRILRYDKRQRNEAMRHIDFGLGAFRPSAFDAWADGESFDLAAVYQRLLAEDQLAGFDVGRRFYEIGSPEGLAETREHLRRKGREG